MLDIMYIQYKYLIFYDDLIIQLQYIVKKQMKPQLRYKNNDLNQLFANRLSYQKHKKKLQQLSYRKSYYIDIDRSHKIDIIKVRKHHSFVKDIIDRNRLINKDNIRIFQKLSTTQIKIPSLLSKDKDLKQMSPFRKRMIQKTEAQNLRLHGKLRSLTASINSRQIAEQYCNTLKIKKRISKFQINNDSKKVFSKTQKFINYSLKSHDSLHKSRNHKLKNLNQDKQNKNSQSKYNKEQIPLNMEMNQLNKNHILKRRKQLYKQRIASRHLPSRPITQTGQIGKNLQKQNIKNGFFTTQVIKGESPNKKQQI